MNLAAKLNWSIPQGISSYHTKKNKKPTISIGKMQITNNIMNKNKNTYFKKLQHSEALFSMALMGHHTCSHLAGESFSDFFERSLKKMDMDEGSDKEEQLEHENNAGQFCLDCKMFAINP